MGRSDPGEEEKRSHQKEQERPQKGPEPLSGVMQPCHHRSNRTAKHLGDLAVRQSFNITQHDNGSVVPGQGVEGTRDLRPLLSPGGFEVGAGRWVGHHALPFFLRDRLSSERPGPGRSLPVAVGGEVHGDAKDPRVERRLATELADRLEGPDEGFLGHIQRLLPVSEDVKRQPPDPLPIFLHQRLERLKVTGLAARDQLPVILAHVGPGNRVAG